MHRLVHADGLQAGAVLPPAPVAPPLPVVPPVPPVGTQDSPSPDFWKPVKHPKSQAPVVHRAKPLAGAVGQGPSHVDALQPTVGFGTVHAPAQNF